MWPHWLVHRNHFYLHAFPPAPGHDPKGRNLHLDVPHLRLRRCDFPFKQTTPKKAVLDSGINLHEHDFLHGIPHRQTVIQTQTVSLGLQQKQMEREPGHTA